MKEIGMKSLAVVLSALLALTACSSSSSGGGGSTAPPSSSSAAPSSTAPAPAPIDLTGTVTLLGPISTGADAMTEGATCIGISDDLGENFEDLAEGTQLEVHDGTGATVGIGSLGTSHMTVVNPLDARTCVFDFTISGIAPGKGIYQIYIGNHATEKLTEADLPGATDLSLKSALYSA